MSSMNLFLPCIICLLSGEKSLCSYMGSNIAELKVDLDRGSGNEGL
jgi:hypothetical protein